MLRPFLTGSIDFLIVIWCAYLAHWMRFENAPWAPNYDRLIPIGALIYLIIATLFGLYGNRLSNRLLLKLASLALSWGISFSLLFIYLVFSKTSEDYSRLWLGYWITLGFFGLASTRLVNHGFKRWMYSNPKNRRKIFLVGDTEIATSIATDEKNLNANGLTITGFFRTQGSRPLNLDSLLIVENVDLGNFVEGADIDEIWICLHLKDEDYVSQLVYELRHTTVSIRQILKTQDLNILAKPITEFDSISTLDISCSPHSGTRLLLKNLEDYILGFIIFVAISPLLLFIALCVKLSSPGPILFKQYRHGVDGKKFKVYKFRSMEVHQEENGLVTQAKRDDPRVTKIGKFLRKTSLDELPQFFNVLQGRMSIVGPRPHALSHNEYYSELIDSYMRRHMVKPGITGWAQVNGYRGETEVIEKMSKRVEFDLYYIENWSIWLDIKILVLTPIALLGKSYSAY